MSDLLLTGISQLVTPARTGAHRGSEMSELRLIPQAAIAISNGRIDWLGPQSEWNGEALQAIDLGGRAVVPGLVDPHTHAVWAGDRLMDFEARSRGESYESILAAGGGIWHTVSATAALNTEQMAELALPRVSALLRSGATTIEVKSGYGYTPEAELRMLDAIQLLAAGTKARIVPTLLVHVCPQLNSLLSTYLNTITRTLIPHVASRRLASAVDVFVEQHAWNSEDARSILTCARDHGLAMKLHTEQFQRVGGLELGVELGALSVDHLEICTAAQCALVARSKTIATLLPGVTLHLGLPAAPGRALVDAGAAVAIGTDLNPGSSPLFSTAAALALSVRLNGLTPSEALVAATVNAAAALGLTDAGCLGVGQPADLLVLESNDWRELPYTLGQSVVRDIWVSGRRQAS